MLTASSNMDDTIMVSTQRITEMRGSRWGQTGVSGVSTFILTNTVSLYFYAVKKC
jgi:hypothetical protein